MSEGKLLTLTHHAADSDDKNEETTTKQEMRSFSQSIFFFWLARVTNWAKRVGKS